MKKNNIIQQLSNVCFRIIRRIVQLLYPKITIVGIEKLPDEPCLLVANHSQTNGPIIAELFIPGPHATWCAGEMMELKNVPTYAYKDFWSLKPAYIRWFYKLLSYLIAPLSVCIFNNADTIAVYRDSRVIRTFRDTVQALGEGRIVTVFPECAEAYNNIINSFQEGFVDLARMYHKRYNKVLAFVPVYIAPRLRKIYVGDAVYFDPSVPKEEERHRICQTLMESITYIAQNLPEHTVVPYLNMDKKFYPKNIPTEVEHCNEKTSR